jgi:hypothetical protein
MPKDLKHVTPWRIANSAVLQRCGKARTTLLNQQVMRKFEAAARKHLLAPANQARHPPNTTLYAPLYTAFVCKQILAALSI